MAKGKHGGARPNSGPKRKALQQFDGAAVDFVDKCFRQYKKDTGNTPQKLVAALLRCRNEGVIYKTLERLMEYKYGRPGATPSGPNPLVEASGLELDNCENPRLVQTPPPPAPATPERPN
jgi:hypothetical protein